MATDAQVNANRENSKLSTGPKTPGGKAASSLNHRTHGFTAADPVLPTENRAEYEALLNSFIEEWTPDTPHKQFLVEQIAGARWKLNRLERIEAEMFVANDLSHEFFADREKSAAFARLDRYRTHLERTYHRSVRELRSMRNDQFEAKVEQAAEKKYCQLATILTHRGILGPIPVGDQLVRLAEEAYEDSQELESPENDLVA